MDDASPKTITLKTARIRKKLRTVNVEISEHLRKLKRPNQPEEKRRDTEKKLFCCVANRVQKERDLGMLKRNPTPRIVRFPGGMPYSENHS